MDAEQRSPTGAQCRAAAIPTLEHVSALALAAQLLRGPSLRKAYEKSKRISIPSGLPPGYVWKWHCEADKKVCKDSFLFYYDCLSNAKKYGYEVELVRAHGATAPDGVEHNMP